LGDDFAKSKDLVAMKKKLKAAKSQKPVIVKKQKKPSGPLFKKPNSDLDDMFGMDDNIEGAGDQAVAPGEETPMEVYDDEDDYYDEEAAPVVAKPKAQTAQEKKAKAAEEEADAFLNEGKKPSVRQLADQKAKQAEKEKGNWAGNGLGTGKFNAVMKESMQKLAAPKQVTTDKTLYA